MRTDPCRPEVVAAGFALPAEGRVVEAPVRVSVTVQPPRAHGQRRRPRPQTTARWHVVQLMEHIPEERVPEAELRRRVAARMLRDRYATEWNLNFIRELCPPVEATDPTLPPAARSAARKTLGLKDAVAKHGFNGLIAGIRRDEEAIRAKERYFSPRSEDSSWNLKDQPPEFWNQYMTSFPEGTHVRVHPLLHWTEVDIWKYTKRESIPVIDLYFAKGGKRYRSLGDQDITSPIASEASTLDEIIHELETTKIPERAGRAMDHESEDAFERLRAAGYL